VEAAYVRALAGPLDYHLGGFRSISREKFVARSENPYVLGTRAHHLAMYVVYDNPMPMVSDTPSAYENQPGFEFIVEVPTTWDETRFAVGEAGEYIVMARRKGTKWYLGGMTNWAKRELKVPLMFLSPGEYKARLFVDGSMNEDEPNAIRVEQQEVRAADTVTIQTAPGGGFAGVIVPAK
jgi:alpha-glucosidase